MSSSCPTSPRGHARALGTSAHQPRAAHNCALAINPPLVAFPPPPAARLRSCWVLSLQAGSLVSNATDAMGAPLELGNITPWKQALLAELRLAGPGADLELHVRPGGEAGVDGRLLAAARVLASRDAAEVSGRGVERLCQLDKPLSKVRFASACACVRVHRACRGRHCSPLAVH